jgi:hypothetical protein
MLNVAEFAKMRHPSGPSAADSLIDLVAPNLFFLEVEPFTVHKREIAVLSGATKEFPAAHDELMARYIEQSSATDHPLLAKRTFSSVFANDALESEVRNLRSGVSPLILTMKHRWNADPEFRAAVERSPEAAPTGRSTFPLLQALLRPYLRDATAEFTENDTMDLLHSIVPSSYCDIVLLDGKWAAAVNTARSLFSARRIGTHLATVFSERNDGLIRALDRLEKWSSPG